MTVRTKNQDAALSWYCNVHNLRPELSAHPVYNFVDNCGGGVQVSMWQIAREYKDSGGAISQEELRPKTDFDKLPTQEEMF